MKVEFSKRAAKFLKKLDSDKQRLVRVKITTLETSLTERKALPFDQLDIKKMKGNWRGYFRVRIGQIRIIFTIRLEADRLYIYDISFRGSAYDQR